MLLSGSNLQLHTSMLPVAKELNTGSPLTSSPTTGIYFVDNIHLFTNNRWANVLVDNGPDQRQPV